MDLHFAHWAVILFCLSGLAIAQEPAARKAVELDVAKLEQCVGQYEIAPNQVLAVIRFRSGLFARIPGRRAWGITPLSETHFVWSEPDGQITFERGQSGEIVSARYDEGEVHHTARKTSDRPFAPVEAPEVLDSPRLLTLAKALDSGNSSALDEFWKEVQDRAPLIEPYPGDQRSSWVTLLYRGNAATRTVSRWGGPWPFSFDVRGANLERLRQTDLWYSSVRMANDTRAAYTFVVNLTSRLPDDAELQQELVDAAVTGDVLNPKFMEATGTSQVVYSVLELPDAPPQPYIHAVEGIPHGKVSRHRIESAFLKEPRSYSVYTPSDQEARSPDEKCPLVVLFDGSAYDSSNCIPGSVILDNLIAAKKIPPTVVAFVDSKNRSRELNCSKEFAAFVANELVPQIRKEHHVSDDARHTTVGGLSIGGSMAAYCALNHSDVFGNVLSQSGAFWIYPGAFDTPMAFNDGGGSLIQEFVKSPRLPVRFYLEAGRFENGVPCDLVGENRRFRDVLLAKGYDVTYSEFNGGHHFLNWRGSFADALMAVSRKQARQQATAEP